MKLEIRNLLHVSAGLVALLISGVTESQDQTPAATASPHFTIRIPLQIQNMDEAFERGWISCRLWRETPSFVELVPLRYANSPNLEAAIVQFDNATGNGPPEAVVTIKLRDGLDPRDAQKFQCQLWLRARGRDDTPQQVFQPTDKSTEVTWARDSQNNLVKTLRPVQVADPSKPFRVIVVGNIP